MMLIGTKKNHFSHSTLMRSKLTVDTQKGDLGVIMADHGRLIEKSTLCAASTKMTNAF